MLENCLQRQPIRLPQELVSTTDVQVTTDTRRPPLCFIPNELGNNTDINLYFREGSVIVDFYVVLSPNSKMNATEIGNAFTKALLSPGALGNYTADPSYTSFEGMCTFFTLPRHKV